VKSAGFANFGMVFAKKAGRLVIQLWDDINGHVGRTCCSRGSFLQAFVLLTWQLPADFCFAVLAAASRFCSDLDEKAQT
jgi:hypothetical protein